MKNKQQGFIIQGSKEHSNLRRRLLQSAWTVPVVTSVMLPAHAQASTGINDGGGGIGGGELGVWEEGDGGFVGGGDSLEIEVVTDFEIEGGLPEGFIVIRVCQTVETAGTYTFEVPSVTDSIAVMATAAGGGGGGGGPTPQGRTVYSNTGGAGGTGAVGQGLPNTSYNVSPGTSLTVVVGAGGTGGANGSNTGGMGGLAGDDTTISEIGVSLDGGNGGGGGGGALDILGGDGEDGADGVAGGAGGAGADVMNNGIAGGLGWTSNGSGVGIGGLSLETGTAGSDGSVRICWVALAEET